MAQNVNCVRITTIFLTQEVPTRWILGPNEARPDQSDLRVSSVFNKEYLGFNDLAKKVSKEMA